MVLFINANRDGFVVRGESQRLADHTLWPTGRRLCVMYDGG